MSDGGSNACPAKDVFVRAFLNELPHKEAARLLDHALRCPRCRLRFQTLAGVGREMASRPGLAGPEGSGPRRRRGFAPIVQAAAVFLVVIGVGAAGVLLFSRRTARPLLRGEGEAVLRVLAPDGPQRVPPARFEWTPLRGAEVYQVEIVGQDLTTIYKGSGPRAVFVLPAPLRRLLIRGAAYVWTVTAFDDDNRPLASSSGSFRVE